MPDILRVTFKKGEGMRYTGHLDILRTFIRSLKRADMPIKYSEGFNPHAVMTFALPLGVGITSDCEIVDIAMKEIVDTDEFISKVNQCTPKGGIEIISAEYTIQKMPNIIKAEYVIEIETKDDFDTSKISDTILNKEIIVEKKSKRQAKEVNLAEHIFDHKIEVLDKRRFVLNVTLSAGNTFNVKPQLLIEGLQKVCDGFEPILVLANRSKFIFE